ncbi:MAG: TonB-dependent receptor plug domain-containing protein [Alphaproteobacteria bacterium]|nr:TonB-dependent receptor plug domain-containing protein [Alphaproteobacteria bacterium]
MMLFKFLLLKNFLKRAFVLFFVMLFSLIGLGQSLNKNVTILVQDMNTKLPVPYATILSSNHKPLTETNDIGLAQIKVSAYLNSKIIVQRLGYSDIMFLITNDSIIVVNLSPSLTVNDDIVVTASRRPEKISQSPSLIDIVKEKDLNNIASPFGSNLYSNFLGVEVVKNGISSYQINTRGFNNAFNAKIIQINDGRISNIPGSLGIPMGNLSSVVKEDIHRIEFVVGPNSALYGPNAHNGVLNIITKDPFESPGLIYALTLGSQNIYSPRLRWAQVINKKWAYKYTIEYTTGYNFDFVDTVYAGGFPYSNNTQPVAIPEIGDQRKFIHFKTEFGLHYKINTKNRLVFNAGYSDNKYTLPNNTGRIYVNDWRIYYWQFKWVNPKNFFQVYFTGANEEATNIFGYTRDYYNRTTSIITNPNNPLFPSFGRLDPVTAQKFSAKRDAVIDDAKRWNAEYQRTFIVPQYGLNIITDFSFSQDIPRTYGTNILDSATPYIVTQTGLGLQIEKTFSRQWKLFVAGRIDYHNKFKWLFAPKFSLVKKLNDVASIRLSYSFANAAPIIIFQKAAIYGFIYGSVDGLTYLPNGGNINNPAEYMTFPKLQVESIETIELGYKNTFKRKFSIDADIYFSKSRNFLSPAISISGRVLTVGNTSIPVGDLAFPGIINSEGILTNNASFSSYLNYGLVHSWGLDCGLNYIFNNKINASLNYSFFDSDIKDYNLRNDANKDGYVSLEERSLNAPNHRATAQLNLNDLVCKNLSFNFTFRYLPAYDFYSGSQIATKSGEGARGQVYGGISPITNQARYYLKNYNYGPLGNFFNTDASVIYYFNKATQFTITASNIFDVPVREFVGTPLQGRIIYFEIKYTL